MQSVQVENQTSQEDDHPVYATFDEMGLKESLLKGIYCFGFEKPSYIQQRAIVPLSQGKDLIAQSQSGTGKTGTFLIGSLQKINLEVKSTQVLVLSPTRELSQQIFNVAQALSCNMDLSSHLLIGGQNMNRDFEKLESRPQLVVGTPGRVFDMLKRFALKSDSIKLIVLDEADEMLSRGFKDQIYEIFQYLSRDTQVGLFSATMPLEALELTKKFMTEPTQILLKNDELTLEGIKQYYVAVDNENWKFDVLCDIYGSIAVSQAIIYCNSKKKADWLREKLHSQDFTAECIHGNMAQKEREGILKGFRNGDHRILLATDIIARGIDIQQVSLVINYDIPRYRETYIHRIGRSGRFGRKGMAINFITPDDLRSIKDIESFYCTCIEELPSNFQESLQM